MTAPRPKPPGRLSANRAFRLLWAGQSVNELGSFISMVALPLLAVSHLNASTLDVGALEAVQWIPAVVIGLPAGALVDRSHHRRHIMMAANLGQAAALASVPVTAAAGVLSLFTLLAAAFAAGLFGVFFQTAYSPFLRAIVPPDQLVAANGRLQSSWSAAQVSGPAIGGVLVQVIGAANAVIADAASFLISLVSLWAIRADEPLTSAPSRQSVRTQIRGGLHHLGADPLLRTMAIVGALANLLLTAIGAVEIVFLVRSVGVTAGGVGVLLATSGIGGLAGALSASPIERWLGTPLTARSALACTAPFALLIPLTYRGAALVFFALGAFAASFGISVVSIMFASLRQATCPPHLLGRVGASSQLLTAVTIPVGAIAGGILGQHIGNRSAILVGAIAYTAVGLAASMSPLRRAPELRLPGREHAPREVPEELSAG